MRLILELAYPYLSLSVSTSRHSSIQALLTSLNISLLDNREARQLDMSKAIMQNETETNLKFAELELKDKEIANNFQIKQQNLRLDAQKEINNSIMENNKVIYGIAESSEAPEEMVTQENV